MADTDISIWYRCTPTQTIVTTGDKSLLFGGEASSFAVFNNLAVLPNSSIFVTKFCQRNDFAVEVFEGS